MNTDAPWPSREEAEARVLEIQTKLHQWASDDPDRRFDDLYNLVCDPAMLMVAWDGCGATRVHARPAWTADRPHVEQQAGVETFLDGLARS